MLSRILALAEDSIKRQDNKIHIKSAVIQLKIGLALGATYYVRLVDEVIGRSQCA